MTVLAITLSEYMKQTPEEFSFSRARNYDNPKKFYMYDHHVFYQKSETEAFVFFNMGDNKPCTELYVVIHLTLDLKNKAAYLDDVFSKRFDDDEYTTCGREIVENEMFDMYLATWYIQDFLGKDIKLDDTCERKVILTDDDWKYYNDARE